MKNYFKKIQLILMKKGYCNPIYKAIILIMCRIGLVALRRYNSLKKEILEAIEKNVDKEKLNNKWYKNKMVNDMLFCYFNYGVHFNEYFIFNFPMLSHEGRKTFVGIVYSNRLLEKLNNDKYKKYFDVKSETYKKYKKYYNRDLIELYDNNDFDKFKCFVEIHNKFIRKPVNDYGGHGVKIFDSTKYNDLQMLFADAMNKGPCVLEELIIQSDELAQFHPQSVNTVRILSFRETEERVSIIWCFFRMGSGGSSIDNMSSGGMAAMIDPTTGVIYTTGRDYNNNKYIYHPETGIKIVGYQLPEWERLLEIVKEAANVLPEMRWIGWDFAYTDKGWILVEGNASPGISMVQISDYNGKIELFKHIEKVIE